MLREHIKNTINEYKEVLICISICILFGFGIYIYRTGDFVLGYDFQYQHLLFYSEFKRLIMSGQAPFWSMNLFLGNNFYASKAYYLIGDPFAYIAILFPLEKLTYGICFSYILKFYFAGLSFFAFLRKIKIKKRASLIGSLFYTFCGWATMFAEHPMFLAWYAFLPILLLGIENILQDNKYSLFIIAIFLIFISNYYLFFTTSVFLTIYWSFRYFQYKNESFISFIKDTMKLIFNYLIGILLSAFLTLPAIIYLSRSYTLANNVEISTIWHPIRIYIDFIIKSLIPSFQVNELGYMLFNTTNYNTNQLSLYSSVLTILLLPQIFSRTKEKKYKSYVAFAIVMIALLLFPIFSSIFHGLNEPNFRWTLLFITIEIIIASNIISEDSINKKILTFSLIVLIATIIVVVVLAKIYYQTLWEHLLPECYALGTAALFLMVYYLLIIKNKQTIIIITVIIELIYSTTSSFNRYPEFQNFDWNNQLPVGAINYIKSINDKNSFYRIYVPYNEPKNYMPHNVNLYYGFMSNSTYDSLLEPSSYKYMATKLNYNGEVRQLVINDISTLKELSYKYLITSEETFLLGKNGYTTETCTPSNETENYKLLDKIDGCYVYEIINSKPFPFEISYFNDNHITGKASSDNKNTITIPIAYDKGWTILINNNKVDVSEKDGFLSIELEKGINEIEMRFIPSGLYMGLLLTFVGAVIFIIVNWKANYKKLSKKGKISNIN